MAAHQQHGFDFEALVCSLPGVVREKNGDVFDKFYTRPATVSRVLAVVAGELSGYGVVIEPAAGGGAFLEAISAAAPGAPLLAYDIAPDGEGITRLDFLERTDRVCGDVRAACAAEKLATSGAIAVGNPPFGRNSKLAVAFFAACARIPEVRTVAFVLPRAFLKPSVQRRVAGFALASSLELSAAECVFDAEGGGARAVPSCFQVWRRPVQGAAGGGRPAARSPPDELGWRRLSKPGGDPPQVFDLQIIRAGGGAGRAYLQEERAAARANYFIALDSPETAAEVVAEINRRGGELAAAVSSTTGPRSLSIPELTPFLNKVVADVEARARFGAFSDAELDELLAALA